MMQLFAAIFVAIAMLIIGYQQGYKSVYVDPRIGHEVRLSNGNLTECKRLVVKGLQATDNGNEAWLLLQDCNFPDGSFGSRTAIIDQNILIYVDEKIKP
jgi:hypothetical protein